MKVCVGRWDLLPAEWEGYNGLVEKQEKEISGELAREVDLWAKDNGTEDNNMGIYNPWEFEETFNYQPEQKLDPDIYWIRIF